MPLARQACNNGSDERFLAGSPKVAQESKAARLKASASSSLGMAATRQCGKVNGPGKFMDE